MAAVKLPTIIAILILLPIVSANPTGLTYMESTWSASDVDAGEIIALNHNNTILATAHEGEVVLYNATTLEKIDSFEMGRVAALVFSPEGEILAVNKDTTIQDKESIKFIDISTLSVLGISALADDTSSELAWSPDGQIIAAPGPEGDVELYRRADLSIKTTLGGVHNVDVTCIDYRSDGEYILTGDESGRYALWNSQGVRQGDYREFGEPLVDCKFTPDGLDYVLLDEKGKTESRTLEGFDKLMTSIDGANEILFSELGTWMHIAVDSDDFKGLLTYEYETFLEAKRTTFFHKLEDIQFTENNNSRLQSLYVAAGTGQIAVYHREIIPFGFNVPGVDLDGDLVPDDIDDDDDGDGIIDEWDEAIGCDAPDGIPCSRYPDLDNIRKLEISLGEKFTITDSITLPPEESSSIRNLSTISIAKDQILSKNEAKLFSNAICANIDHGDVIDQWINSIQLSNGELGEGTVRCKVNSGMEDVGLGDSTTQISFSIITTFSYENRVTFPVEISLTEQTLPTEGSISWLAPAHPISLEINGDGAVTEEIPLWWNDGEDFTPVTIEELILPEPTLMENIVEWSTNPLAFILYIGLISISGLLLIRRDNKIDINLDDDLGDEEEFESDSDESEDDKGEILEEENAVTDNKPKRTPPVKSNKKVNVDNPVSRKKRKASKQTDLNKSGPITTTKKKRLVQKTEEQTAVPKKRTVKKDSGNTVKTRKVKQAVESPEKEKIIKRKTVKKDAPVEVKEETKTKKKKRSVKRKSKSTKSKDIDEDKLQEDLASEFLNDD